MIGSLGKTKITLIRKTDSWLMKLIRPIASLFCRTFTSESWSTITLPLLGATIYVPSKYDEDEDWGEIHWRLRHKVELEHQKSYIKQANQYTTLGFFLLYFGPSPFLLLLGALGTYLQDTFSILSVPTALLGASILLAPLTIGFAWGRYILRRTAYMVDLVSSTDRVGLVEDISKDLWGAYFYTFPKKKVRKWFMEQVEALEEREYYESLSDDFEEESSPS